MNSNHAFRCDHCFVKGSRHITQSAYAVSAVFIALLLAGFLLMPPFAVDLWFNSDIYAAGLKGTSRWEAACGTIANHYLNDNGRLSNIIFTLSLLLPRWIGSLVGAGAFGAAMLLSYRVVAESCRREVGFTTAVAMTVLWIFALPWYDSAYLACYQFNYLIPTALCCWLVSLSLSPSGNTTWKNTLPLLIPGAIAGGWHEGFSVPLFAGVIALLVFRPDYRNRRNLILLVGLSAGIAWIFSSPAALARAGMPGSVLSRIVVVLALHPAFLLCAAVAAVLMTKEKWRRPLVSPLCILLGISAVVSMAIHVLSVRAPRAGWWCEFASVVIMGYMFSSYIRRPGRLFRIAGVLLLLLGFARLAVCDVYAWRYRSQYDTLVESYKASADGTVYLDFTPEYASPVIAWMAPSFNIYYDRYQRWMFARCYGSEEKMPVVIPCRLADLRPDDGRLLDGNMAVRQFGDFYFCSQDELTEAVGGDIAREGEFLASIKAGPVKMDSVRMFYFLYENSHGERLALLLPWRVFPVSPVFRIEGMWIS